MTFRSKILTTAVLAACGVSLSGCLVAGVAGATLGAAGAVVGGAAKGVGAVAGAVIPGGHDKR